MCAEITDVTVVLDRGFTGHCIIDSSLKLPAEMAKRFVRLPPFCVYRRAFSSRDPRLRGRLTFTR